MKKTVLIILLLLVSLSGFFSLFRDAPEPRPGRQQEPSLRMILLVDSIATVIRSPQRRAAAGRCLFSPADEALDKAFALLSAGNQVEAEEVVSWAVLKDLDNPDLLFAKAVLERSRWSKFVASECFLYLLNKAVEHPVIAAAADLSLQLDRGEFSGVNLTDLIRLSDENPDNLYLLWLSAIQCREQAKGELGKQQYEKLLSRFEVGPVMAHHTFANILTEYLKNYDEAMKHRHIAVALEEKSWTLEGLANTLTYSGRYDEACEVWVRAVQLAPDRSKSWGNWGWTLRKMGRYEEALEKHLEACRLNRSSSYNQYYAGKCLEKLGRSDEMIPFFRRAAELEDDRGQFKMGYLHQKGIGVEQDFEKAAEWYRLAADQGHLQAMDNLGLLYVSGQGVELNPEKAVSLYEKVLGMDPNHAHVMNSYAWLLATCKEESLRNFPRAVRLAERSVELDEQFYSLDTLAVAYDRNAQYDKAVEAQKRLIALRQKRNPGKEIPPRMMKRLNEYEQQAGAQR